MDCTCVCNCGRKAKKGFYSCATCLREGMAKGHYEEQQ